jgi:hypothetical protein
MDRDVQSAIRGIAQGRRISQLPFGDTGDVAAKIGGNVGAD